MGSPSTSVVCRSCAHCSLFRSRCRPGDLCGPSSSSVLCGPCISSDLRGPCSYLRCSCSSSDLRSPCSSYLRSSYNLCSASSVLSRGACNCLRDASCQDDGSGARSSHLQRPCSCPDGLWRPCSDDLRRPSDYICGCSNIC